MMPQAFDPQSATPSKTPPLAFVLDEESEAVLRQCFDDLGIVGANVTHGDVDTAVHELARQSSPRLLIVDISGIDDPITRLSALAEVCEPGTSVLVIGDRNDIGLYRYLRNSGISDYFYKPIVGDILKRACNAVLTGIAEAPELHRGKLIFVPGVRGGAGATTLAVNTAWYLAESRKRLVALVDLDLQFGDAALQLDAAPTHALREALESPDRLDDVFLERGIIHVTERLGLLASLENLAERVSLSEDAILALIGKLLPRYRYVFVDLPLATAGNLMRVLRLPSAHVLVSSASLVSARDVARWRQHIGPDTQDRSTIHLVNKNGAHGSLPAAEFARAAGAPPDIEIPYLREVGTASIRGLQAVADCGSLQRGLAPLYRRLSGADVAGPSHSLLGRLWG